MNLCLLLNFLHEIWISLWCNTFLYQISNLVYSCLFLFISVCFFMLEISTSYIWSCLFLSIPVCSFLFLSAPVCSWLFLSIPVFTYLDTCNSDMRYEFFYTSVSFMKSEFLCLNFLYEISLPLNFLSEIWIFWYLNFVYDIWIYFFKR